MQLSSDTNSVLMTSKKHPFVDNRLYELLRNSSMYSDEILRQLNALLHEQPELVELHHPNEGSYFHLICRHSSGQDNVSFRMIYALSNAGADPNVTDGYGNTPLHLIRDFDGVGFDFIQALFRIGVDPRTKNQQGKTADAYFEDNPQLTALYNGYGQGIWAAIETSNIKETERLVKGFTKVDCKHNSNTSLLDKARDLNCTPIIHILADYQVTIEFIHSILACDWDRASLVYKYQAQFLKVNAADSLHTFTWARPNNRTCSKSLLEICLDTHALESLELLFSSPNILSKIDVNALGTDGLPLFFHAFDRYISADIRNQILSRANMTLKSCKGESLLFHLVHLIYREENQQILTFFTDFLRAEPFLVTLRNENGRTIMDEIELTPEPWYDKLRPFYNSLIDVLTRQLKNDAMIERLILAGFGYHLLLLSTEDKSQMTKSVIDLLKSLTVRQGLPATMADLAQAIAKNDLTRVQDIFKMKPKIPNAKDWSGRSCAHLAVLHRHYDILKFICERQGVLVNSRDNLNRTPLHYACIMNDKSAIGILLQANAKKTYDCMNLFPDDFLAHRDLCSEEFHAKGFPRDEIERCVLGIGDYLKLAFYPRFKVAIEADNINQIKSIHNDMIAMGFHLSDFNPNSYTNDWLRGQRYVPLLFLALEHRSLAALHCLIELGAPLVGRMYISRSKDGDSHISGNSRCISIRGRAEELECFDIVGMINDLEDDTELKAVFQRHLSAASQTTDGSSTTQGQKQQQQPYANTNEVPKKQRLTIESTARNQQDRTQTNPKSPACILL